MRLWHKSLISYLPRQQLLGQWRECCCIAKNIAEKGTPNHILVNRIMNYPLVHFYRYCGKVCSAMIDKSYKINWNKLIGFENYEEYFWNNKNILSSEELFSNWHNDRYLIQCMYNLEEKHDCQDVTDEEWNVLLKGYKNITGKDWAHDIP